MVSGVKRPRDMLSSDTGTPYCLRRDSVALRNMQDYSGVSASRLEVLEERLKSDVIAEIGEFHGRVLLHTETAEGNVVPVWESVAKQDVASIREVMNDARKHSKDVHMTFIRIPVTSESSPDVSQRTTYRSDTTVSRSKRVA